MRQMRAAKRLGACFRQPEKTHLAFLHELRHRADAVLDRHLWIHAVQVVQVDDVDTEALQTALAARFHALGTAVHFRRRAAAGRRHEAELARQHDFAPTAANRSSDQQFVRARAIYVRRIE